MAVSMLPRESVKDFRKHCNFVIHVVKEKSDYYFNLSPGTISGTFYLTPS